MKLTLIQRDQCHLCDLAWEALAAAGVADFDPLWIDDDMGLQARYGERIAHHLHPQPGPGHPPPRPVCVTPVV